MDSKKDTQMHRSYLDRNHNVQIYQCIPNVLQVEQSHEAIMLEQFVI